MSSNGSLQPPMIITALPRPPATIGAPTGASLTTYFSSPAPSSSSASFSPYTKSLAPSARRIAMEGKSLFTCHQCGALLKFQYSPVSIEEKIMKLRPIAYEHPLEPSDQRNSKGEDEEDEMPRLTEGTDVGETTDAEEEEEAAQIAARSSLSQQQQQQKTSAIVPEIVWERQRLDYTSDVGVWVPAEFDLMNGIAAYSSCNRGDIGQEIADVVPVRLLNKPHLWMSDWEVDHSLPNCDEEGWVYAASHADFDKMEESLSSKVEAVEGDEQIETAEKTDAISQERIVRRRCLIRKRRIDGSDLSWFQELLDCRYSVKNDFVLEQHHNVVVIVLPARFS